MRRQTKLINEMTKVLFLTLVILTLSCKVAQNDSQNDLSKSNQSDIMKTEISAEIDKTKYTVEIPTVIKPISSRINRVYKRREDIDKLIHDTISNAQDKFLKIFNEDLISSKSIAIKFIKDTSYSQPGSYTLINNFSKLRDSIKENKVDLDSNSIAYNRGDTAYFAFEFANGAMDTIRWDPNEWGAYEFRGYFKDLNYYWIQQVDHGESDYYINSENGKVLDFLPHYSIDKTFYHDIKTYEGYGDASYIQFLMGKELLTPEIDIIYEFSPFLISNKYYSRFGFDDITWISDRELSFTFYHIQTSEYENSDTLYYDNIGVKINYAP